MAKKSTAHSARNLNQISFLVLLPTLFVWLSGFLSQGAHIEVFAEFLDIFHSLPFVLLLVVDLGLPIVAFGYAWRGKKGNGRTVLLIASGMLTIFAMLGLLFAPKPY